MFIRASRESHSKELALLVRRKGVSLRMEPQPDFESGFPSLGQTILLPGDCGESMLHCGGTLEESMLHCGGTLEESMAHLRKGLQSGVLLVQFEMETGVRSGEAGAGPVKRYPKCHQYWPDPPEVREYGGLQVCCHSEECNLAYVFREFTLTNTKYVAWPDHGVPEDPSDFLDFVRFVRNKRSEAEPLTVHCRRGSKAPALLMRAASPAAGPNPPHSAGRPWGAGCSQLCTSRPMLAPPECGGAQHSDTGTLAPLHRTMDNTTAVCAEVELHR
ncbi:hypothetical protein JZ751_020438 [Albula glossodonta]|uniref:Tyrosine-protein phosphatase domain-containing protein n=1 Tax=Albula glossodonta TaxID=121402 RepID=A0A8T2MSD5_9TELE|nr:hypothetical protein JZ751_020438 [Albula glossodonta]